MQNALVMVLVAVLIASTASFVVMGLSQRRRTWRLARRAHEMGMRFSADDPFDVPNRYAAFALIGGGHSPRASNVTYGHVEGSSLRAFDFRCELGHGTRRLSRHYGVIVAEVGRPAPEVLMWHRLDAQFAPLAGRIADGAVGPWRVAGDAGLAAALGRACQTLADQPVSVQAAGNSIMFCVPIRRRRQDYLTYFQKVLGVLRAMRQAPADADQPTCR